MATLPYTQTSFLPPTMKILLVAGARPNFIKVASIIEAIKEFNQSNSLPIYFYLVHTGQHYDTQMSKTFFDELDLPKPNVDLAVGSATHAEQTAEIMKRISPIISREEPDVVMVVGDVNSTLACALVASKMIYSRPTFFPGTMRPLVAHVESGLRSFDRSMPEEINRIVTDAISDLLFITEESARQNLLRENVSSERIFFVGNTMVDTLLKYKHQAESSSILRDLGLQLPSSPQGVEESEKSLISGSPFPSSNKDYIVLTLHRPSNVDDKHTFQELIEAISELSQLMPVLFSVHPRTLGMIQEFGFQSYFRFPKRDSGDTVSDCGIYCIDSLGYFDFLWLLSNARLVMTDSGGIQEESTILRIPCVTLRNNTERPVTVDCGTNVVAGTKRENIVRDAMKQLHGEHKPPAPPYWDGQAGKRIIDALAHLDQLPKPISGEFNQPYRSN